uniref:Uncharacterized protein n=1 Tax=Glossina brevipalpis TaxID=37001 RepID=A0A1A9WT83_9MUSC
MFDEKCGTNKRCINDLAQQSSFYEAPTKKKQDIDEVFWQGFAKLVKAYQRNVPEIRDQSSDVDKESFNIAVGFRVTSFRNLIKGLNFHTFLIQSFVAVVIYNDRPMAWIRHTDFCYQ